MSNKNNKKKAAPAVQLKEQLAQSFPINKARLMLVALFIIGGIQVCSVNLTKVAVAMPSETKANSSYRRLQRFFSNFEFPSECLARFVVNLLPITKYILALDRTNWKWGKKEYQHFGFRDCLSRGLFPGFLEAAG